MPRPITILLALALLSAQLALGLSFALENAPVWDEVPTFAQGLYLARTGRWDIPGCLNHPPLTWYLQSLPLAFVGLEEGEAWTVREPPEDPAMRLIWRGVYDPARGQALLYGNAGRWPEDRLLLLTRLPTLALSLGASVILFLWARRLHGDAGALVALAVHALSPSLLAHGALATTDAALAAVAIAAAWAFERASASGGWRRWLLAGVALGLAWLAKYTALLLLGPFALLVLIAALRRPQGERLASLRSRATGLAAVVVIAILVVVAGYQGHAGHYLDGVEWQRVNVKHGQTGMALGELSRHGWWWFYPFVMAVKTPPGALALALVGLVLWLRREGASHALLHATLPFLFFLAFFLVKQLPVGVRYVLPVYPALALAAGAVAARPWRSRALQVAVVGAALAADAVGLARSHPRELSYVSPLAGGERNGWRLLADSNLDWGQDLKALRAWMQAKGIDVIQLGYFGTADPSYYGIRYLALPSLYLRSTSSAPRAWPPTGLIAVSATCYWGLCDAGPEFGGRNPYEFLHGREPDDRVGGSILIFDLR